MTGGGVAVPSGGPAQLLPGGESPDPEISRSKD